MNLYEYHDKPEALPGYEKRFHFITSLAFDELRKYAILHHTNEAITYKGTSLPKDELSACEKSVASVAKYSYLYAKKVLYGRFPAGEVAISKRPFYSLMYAKLVIKGRWKMGEEAIHRDEFLTKQYATFLKSINYEPL